MCRFDKCIHKYFAVYEQRCNNCIWKQCNRFFFNFTFAVFGLNRVGTVCYCHRWWFFLFVWVTWIEFLVLHKSRTQSFLFISCTKLHGLHFKMLSSSLKLPNSLFTLLSSLPRAPGDQRETQALRVSRGHQGSRWELDYNNITSLL